MNTVNETGWNAGRYLYRAHETGSNSAVTVTDLETGESRVVAQHADWERFDGIAWTPWGTILAAEETGPAGQRDPDFPDAVNGLVYEIDPRTGAAVARPEIGSRSHEGLRFDARGNLYGISERGPGYIYKFVPRHRGDLSSGQLYALRIVEDQGDRTGWAEWVALDQTQVSINSDAAAEAVGATGYARPEDVETGTSTGSDRRGDRMLYVAVTGEDRVLAIDLLAGTDGRRGQVLVTDYVRDGVNAPADFDAPDNLALDQDGNLFITEDPGGTAPNKTKGDDVWLARFDRSNSGQAPAIVRFFSISDCNAEPTGIYFSKSGRSLFVNIQHRGGDGRDGVFAIQKISKVDFLRTDHP
jgi:secreted PhoX family phosphatase